MKIFRLLPLLLLPLAATLFAACDDEENDLGLALQDPSTIYNAKFDTIVGNDIYCATLLDDSLLTSGYTTAMLGNYSDATYGSVNAEIFTQLSLPTTTGLNLGANGSVVDSVVLTLAVSDVFPDTTSSHTLHLTLSQLDSPIVYDSNTRYYAHDTLKASKLLTDTTFDITAKSGSVIRLKVGGDMTEQLAQYYGSQADFNSAIKGFRLRAETNSDPLMLTIDFSNSSTMLRAHYTYTDDNGDLKHDSTNFIVGAPSSTASMVHFCHFAHNYTGSPIAPLADKTQDSLLDRTTLYLEPMGGTMVLLNIDKYLKAFHSAHPSAVINYAELLLPVKPQTDEYPDQIVAFKRHSSGYTLLISDNNYMLSPFAYQGFDGGYHANEGYYRLRISQYMQESLRDNTLSSLMLYINGRRSTARRVVINGPDHATNPLKIAIIYSE